MGSSGQTPEPPPVTPEEALRDLTLLPEESSDDTDSGWGEGRSEQDYLRERPPHHGD